MNNFENLLYEIKKEYITRSLIDGQIIPFNIEMEMEIIHNILIKRKLPNPFKVTYEGDKVVINYFASPDCLISFSDNFDNKIYIRNLYVLPKKRGQGIASKQIKELCKINKGRLIYVEATDGRLWIKNGFKKQGKNFIKQL